MRVLVVQADAEAVQLALGGLAGVEPTIAVDGAEAAELLDGADVLVLDLDVAPALLEDERLHGIPFVALARAADDLQLQRAYGLGARACFAKPIEPAFLRAVVEVLAAAIPVAPAPDDLQAFAHAASHDLQEPLRMVSSFTQLLAERYGEVVDDRGRQYLDFAHDGAKRMRRMIVDLLAWSRVRTRGEPLEPVDAGTCLDRALTSLRDAVRESGAAIDRRVEARVLADAAQLEEVFRQLLANALACRSDRPLRISVAAEREGSRIVFTVRDNGIGIAPQHADRVFALFHRLHRNGDGTGMGLPVCRRIVHRHGGSIDLASDGSTGTTVRFTLRAAD